MWGKCLALFSSGGNKKRNQSTPHYAYGKQHLAFEVKAEDYLKIRDKLSKKEIKVTHIQDWGNGLSSFYFEDPFGNVLEIVPQGIWE